MNNMNLLMLMLKNIIDDKINLNFKISESEKFFMLKK